MTDAPRPWLEGLDELPPELARALRSAVIDEPRADELARLEARLSDVLRPPPGGGGGSGPGSGGLGVWGLGLAACVAAAIVAAVLAARPAHDDRHPRGPEPRARPASAPIALAPPPAEPTPRAPPPAEVEAPAPAPALEAPRRPPPPTEDGIAEEARFLRRMRALLATDPAAALGLAEEHRRRFPAGRLGQERDVIAVEALVRTGRSEEARARAARFAADHPGSGHLPHLESLTRQ